MPTGVGTRIKRGRSAPAPEREGAARGHSRGAALCVHALLAAAIAAVYAPVANFHFVNWDDPAYVVDNPVVRAGLTREGLVWAFTSAAAANWHPLTWISHMADCELFGLDAGAHHVVGVAWHALCTLLLFELFRRTTGRLWPAAAVAALFALHPMHVESVAWVSERKDVTSTAFALAAMLAHAAWARRRAPAARAAVLGLMVLSLLCKPMYVTLPVLLLLLDRWPLGRPPAWGLVVEKIPLVVVALASSAVTLAVQRAGGAVASIEEVSLGARAANALVSYAAYLELALWPASLSFHYPHPGLPGVAPLGAGEIIRAGLFGAGAALVVWRSRSPRLTACALWYVVTLLPVIGLVPVGAQGMADRYTYLALVGPFVVACYGAADLGARLSARRPALRRWWQPLAGVAALALLAACATRAAQQVGTWRDSRSLLESAVAARPDAPLVLNNLAWLLATHPDPQVRDPRRAVDLAERAVDATRGKTPSYVDTLAAARAAAGEFEQAAEIASRTARALRAAGASEPAAQVEQRAAAFRRRQVFVDDEYDRLEGRPGPAPPGPG
jgi:hypothetical protein